MAKVELRNRPKRVLGTLLARIWPVRGGQNGPRSPVSVARKASFQAHPRLFGRFLTADCVRFERVGDRRNGTVPEGPEGEGAGRRRPRDAPRGGRAGLRSLRAYHTTLLRLRRETGAVEAKPVPGAPARKGAALGASLPAQARANPDLTLAEHCELFEEAEGVGVSTAPR